MSAHIEKKIDAICECKSQGGGESRLAAPRAAGRGGQAAALAGRSDATADREYVRQFLLDENREYGKPHKVEYAERFWYIDERRHAKVEGGRVCREERSTDCKQSGAIFSGMACGRPADRQKCAPPSKTRSR